MTQLIATIIYVAGIVGLFYLDRDRNVRTSWALWIPTIWMLIIGSRRLSDWFNTGPMVSQEQGYLDGNPINVAVFGVLIAAGVVVLSLRSRRVKGFLRGNAPLLLFFAYCALSTVWSDYSFVALKRWTRAVGDPMMVLILLTDPNPLGATKRFLSRAGFVLLPLSVLFIKYFPNLGRSYNQWTWVPMYSGITTGKNELGVICLVFGLGSLWSFIGAYLDRQMPYRVRHLVAHGIIIFLAIWLCKTANSMTPLSCLFMAGAVMVLTTRRWVARSHGAVHALVGGCVALSLFALFFDTGGSLVHELGRNATLTGRTAIWRAVLSIHTNPLVGTGFASFWMGNRLERVWETTEKGLQEAHNGYLELYLNLGLAGVALLATLIVSGYRNALAVFRRDPHAGRLRLAFFTAGVIYSLTEAGFTMQDPIWVAFLLAITYVPPGSRRMERKPASEWLETQAEPPAETQTAPLEYV